MATSKAAKKELCRSCDDRPYDVICQCGDKFDFGCIIAHVNIINTEYDNTYETVGRHLVAMSQLEGEQGPERGHKRGSARQQIDAWERSRTEQIRQVAAEARGKLPEDDGTVIDTAALRVTYNALSEMSHHSVHDRLNRIIEFEREIRQKLAELREPLESAYDTDALDSAMRAHLESPAQALPTAPHEMNGTSWRTTSESIVSRPPTPTRERQLPEEHYEQSNGEAVVPDLMNSTSALDSMMRSASIRDSVRSISPRESLRDTSEHDPVSNGVTDHGTQDDFEAGLTAHIQSHQAMSIAANNDEYAATVCCHDDELLYLDHDAASGSSKIILIVDINQATKRRMIDWTPSGLAVDPVIRDIVYSDKLGTYILLNYTGLYVLNAEKNSLEEFHPFPSRKLKRISCDANYIYLISPITQMPFNDQIILLKYDKGIATTKSLQDIIPSRLSRARKHVASEVTDIAVSDTREVLISYRINRTSEVGVFLFGVSADGTDWTTVKHLTLNECWHATSNFTPRAEWCAKLKVFVLIEYITGHLIMIAPDGDIPGECRLMNPENDREAPLNLSISTSDWLCTRYDSAIVIKKNPMKNFPMNTL